MIPIYIFQRDLALVNPLPPSFPLRPDSFWGREADSATPSQTHQAFLELEQQISDHYNCEHTPKFSVTNPMLGKVYIGRVRSSDSDGSKWRRVQVMAVFTSKTGKNCTVRLLDYGGETQIYSAQLQEIPEQFLSVEYQAKHFTLHDIVPITLQHNYEEFSTSLQPSDEWDEAAISTFAGWLKEFNNFEIKIMGNIGKKVAVELYGQNEKFGKQCINEYLVKKEYATYAHNMSDDILQTMCPSFYESRKAACDSDASSQQWRSSKDYSDLENSIIGGIVNTNGVRLSTGQDYVPTVEEALVPHIPLSGDVACSPEGTSIAPLQGLSNTQNSSRVTGDHHVLGNQTSVSPRTAVGHITGERAPPLDSPTASSAVSPQREGPHVSSPHHPMPGKGRGMKLLNAAGHKAGDGARLHGSPTTSSAVSPQREGPHASASSHPMPAMGRGMKLLKAVSPQRMGAAGDGPQISAPNQPMPCMGRGMKLLNAAVNTHKAAGLNRPKIGSGVDSDSAKSDSVCKRKDESVVIKDSLVQTSVVEDVMQSPAQSQPKISVGRGRLKQLVQETLHSPQRPGDAASQQKQQQQEHHQQQREGSSPGGLSGRFEDTDPPVKMAFGRGAIIEKLKLSPKVGGNTNKDSDVLKNTFVNNQSDIHLNKSSSSENHSASSLNQNEVTPNRSNPSVIQNTAPLNETVSCEIKSSMDQSSLLNSSKDQNFASLPFDTTPPRLEAKPLKSRLPRLASSQSSDDSSSPRQQQRKIQVSFSDQEEVHEIVHDSIITPIPVPMCNNTGPLRSILKRSSSSEGVDSTKLNESDSVSDNVKSVGDLQYTINLMDKFRPKRQLYEECDKKGEQPEDQQVLYIGGRYKPARSLNDLPFADLFKMLHGREHLTPKKLQLFLWPALLRMKHVAAVGPTSSGKTTAWLVPLVQQIASNETYTGLRDNGAPLVVVLCSSWVRVHQLYQLCVKVCEPFKHKRGVKVRPLLCYGGGDKNVELQLLGGCEILVATAPCLLKMIDKSATTLDRLCHLILDDADNLTHTYPEELRRVMLLRSEVLPSLTDAGVPQQIVICAKKWSLPLTFFVRDHMDEPVIVIASQTEAAIFGNVKQTVVTCGPDQRIKTVLDMIDPATCQGQKIIVVAHEAKDAEKIAQYLEQMSLHVKCVHHESDSISMIEVKNDWKVHHRADSMSVLVTTDRCLEDLSLTDATKVIHFDPPSLMGKKARGLGQRLWTMRQNYANLVQDIRAQSKCQSVLLVCRGMEAEARTYCRLLERCNVQVPGLLREMADEFEEQKSRDDMGELCAYMKALGECSVNNCSMRHTVVAKFDTPGSDPMRVKLPTEGQVKIFVNKAVSAVSFGARLIEVSDKDGLRKCDKEWNHLTFEMCCHYVVPENKKQVLIPVIGTLYAWENLQHTFQRVLLKALTPINKDGRNEKAKVYFVDEGHMETVKTEDLYELDPKFTKIPWQGFEVYCCRVKPVDRDSDFTDRARGFIADTIQKESNKQLEGKVVLSMTGTLWLDPLVHRIKLDTVKSTVSKFSVRTLLLQEKYAEDNRQHLHKLYAASTSKLHLPEAYDPETSTCKAYTAHGAPIDPDVAYLPEEDGDSFSVLVSAVCHPDLFYVQLLEGNRRLRELEKDIHRFLELNQLAPLSGDIRKGTLVLARFPSTNDDQEQPWLRAKVIDVLDDGDTVDVMFVDTGEVEFLPRAGLLPIPSQFMHLPFQAIEASLHGLQCPDDEWDQDDNTFWDMTRVPGTDNPKTLVAKVVGKVIARSSGIHHYQVMLYDTSQEYDVDVGAKLVIGGKALLSTRRLESLFPLDKTENVKRSYKTIPTLSKTLFHIPAQAASTTESIWANVQAHISERAGIREAGILQCLVNILSYNWSSAVVATITKTLALLAKDDDDTCLELCFECGILHVLCHLLDTQTDDVIVSSVLFLLTRLVRNQGCCLTLLRNKAPAILGRIIRQDDALVAARRNAAFVLLRTIDELPYKEDENIIIQSDCIPNICEALSTCTDSEVLEYIITMILKFASHTLLKDEVRRAGGIKALCSRLQAVGTTSLTVGNQQLAVRALRNLATGSRFNKDAMNEVAMIDTFKRLGLTDRLGEEAVGICREMVERLTAVLPSEQYRSSPRRPGGATVLPPAASKLSGRLPHSVMLNQPLPAQILQPNVVNKRCHPEVKWSQSKWGVLLCVQVKGVDSRAKVATFTQNSVKFSAVADQTEFVFEFALYEMINPGRCETQILGSEVRLGLVKVTKGRWPTLVKDKKHKPVYLKVDFNRMVDSDSEDSSDAGVSGAGVDAQYASPLEIAKRNVLRPVPFARSPDAVRRSVPDNVLEEDVVEPRDHDTDTDDEPVERDLYRDDDYYNII